MNAGRTNEIDRARPPPPRYRRRGGTDYCIFVSDASTPSDPPGLRRMKRKRRMSEKRRIAQLIAYGNQILRRVLVTPSCMHPRGAQGLLTVRTDGVVVGTVRTYRNTLCLRGAGSPARAWSPAWDMVAADPCNGFQPG